MCLDEETLSEDFPRLETGKAFGMLLLALCECGLSHGIETLVSNYEPHLARVYRRAGLSVEEVGRADGYGRSPVCCGIFEVSEEVRTRIQQALGIGIPSQFLSMLPYLATIVVLVAISGNRRATLFNTPASLGKPFVPDR